MIIVLAALLAATAFVVLVRVLWLSARPGRYATLVTVAAAVLVFGLAVLAATGRLHWLAAVAAAVFPFLRRGVKLLRFLPWIGSLLRSAGNARTGSAGSGSRGRPRTDSMSREQALEVLGLGTQPTRDEVLAAHRRLIQRLHPDRGGSTYLAQQLNEAKQRLLDDLQAGS